MIVKREDESDDVALSKTLLKPEVSAAFCLQALQPINTVGGLRAALTEQINDVHNGNLQRPEAMLLTQAHTLDALFNSLAQKALVQTEMPRHESYMRLAFKAQAQCRTTLEALATIKNPPIIFAKQANITNGHQQINNGIYAPRTENNQNQPNELLTELPHETLDSGRKGEAIEVYTELAALD